MAAIKNIETVPRTKGIASTVKVNDFIPQYTEAVARFLKDNASLGEDWQKNVASKLYNFQGKNDEGDVLGSSTYMGVALATFMPEIPLIGGKQLLELYQQAGDKNPFGGVYIDFGVQLNGNPQTNKAQAKALLDSFKKYGIKTDNGRVPDFAQLRLVADKDSGLVFTLAEDAQDDKVANVSDLPFGSYVGKNGLFRAYLGWDGHWYAGDGNLADSNGNGRVVRYDAEGVVVPKKSEVKTDLVTKLSTEFAKRF